MKRKTLSYTDTQATLFLEYLACGNEIFVLNFELEQSREDDRTLEDLVRLKLGEDVTARVVEQSQIF